MKTLKITILSLVLTIPNVLLSQNNNVIKIMRFKSDTSTTPYETTYYVAKDTLNGVIYRKQKKLTDDVVKTKLPTKNKLVKRRNKKNSDA